MGTVCKLRADNESTLPYRYRHDRIVYYGSGHQLGWGSFCVDNRKRSCRVLLPDRLCPFCSMIDSPSDRRISLLLYKKHEYFVIENKNPTVDEQLLVFPPPSSGSAHQCSLEEIDFKLIAEIAVHGFFGVPTSPVSGHPEVVKLSEIDSSTCPQSGPYVIYVNPSPESSQTEPHLHMNCVPSGYVPHLSPERVSSTVDLIRDQYETVISRLVMPGFSAFRGVGTSVECVALTLATFNAFMLEWSVPYSLVAYPSGAASSKPSFLIIPRSTDYSATADQRIGALEFFTGVLLPGVNRVDSMNVDRRDAAFAETTLGDEAFSELERKLAAPSR